ncbi:MAG TPA: lipopolysaccharide heptosyltransferase II, partial [Burkholderiales bacterium]|nr:lipopolysaccharide heptosyltransferase II [Burkholderiales bacterium]
MRKILVVGPSWVGDTVLAQPMMRLLHARHAGLALDVLAPGWTAPVLERMPEVGRVLPSPFAHGELGLAQRWRLARELAAEGYDQAIVLPNTFKSALVPFFAGIRLRTGYVGELRRGLLNDARRLDAARLPQMAERFAALALAPGEALPRPLPAPRLRAQ